MKIRITSAREIRRAVNGNEVTRECRAGEGIELRAATVSEESAGYIGAICGEIPFNSDSALLSQRGLNKDRAFIERIAPGAFKQSLDEDRDVMGFVGHTDDPLSAFARAGRNLTLTADGKSLTFRALIPDTGAGRDLLTLTQNRIIRGTSFEFSLRPAGEVWSERNGVQVRTIVSARLYTVNPVAFPAYPGSCLVADSEVVAASDSPDESRGGAGWEMESRERWLRILTLGARN